MSKMPRALRLRAIEILSSADETISHSEAVIRAATERCNGDREAALLLCVDYLAASMTSLWRNHVTNPDNWNQQLDLGIVLPLQIPLDGGERYVPKSQATVSQVERFMTELARKLSARAYRVERNRDTIKAVRDAAAAAGIDCEQTPFVDALAHVADTVRPTLRVLRENGRREIE